MAILATALMVTHPADAHGFHAAFTVVEADAREGRWRIVHRMFTQDIDVLIKARTNAEVTTRGGLSFEAALEGYLRTTFALRDETGSPVALTLSRVMIADDVVVAYFDGPLHADSNSLAVDSQILMETNPDQVNTVNVTWKGETQTAVFRDGDKPRALTFN